MVASICMSGELQRAQLADTVAPRPMLPVTLLTLASSKKVKQALSVFGWLQVFCISGEYQRAQLADTVAPRPMLRQKRSFSFLIFHF